jgi:hypothetical protein
MHLTATDPLRRYGRSFFDFYPRDQGEGEFFFERVPLGQFYLTSLAKPRVFVRKVVNVESDQLKLPVEIDLPRSTASISGRVAPAIADSGRLLQLIPTDRSWFAYSSIEDDGNFAFNAVPTGECTISVLKHLTWEPIQTLQLSDGPNEHLSIKGKDDHPFLPNGVSAIRVCTPDGAITDCHVSLKGPHGVINSSNEDGGQYHFCVPPGNYQATVRLKGFQTEELPIEVFPFTVDGTANPNRLTTVILREQ